MNMAGEKTAPQGSGERETGKARRTPPPPPPAWGARGAAGGVRVEQYGKNELPSPKADGYVLMFVRQFASPLIYLLLGAGVVVFFLGEVADAVIIFLVLIFNAAVGVMQEGRAQRTLDALRVF